MQDCLVEWLRSRGGGGGAARGGGGAEGGAGGVPDDASALQAQRCELCREKLVFKARYRPGAPAKLGIYQVGGGVPEKNRRVTLLKRMHTSFFVCNFCVFYLLSFKILFMLRSGGQGVSHC